MTTHYRQVIFRTKLLPRLTLFITLGILLCTLWPFDAFPPNRVSWLEQSNGIRFRQRGVVLSQPIATSAPASDIPCTLELWITPAQTNSVFTILNIYDPANPYRFLIRQYLVGLIISHDVAVPHRKSVRVKIDVNTGLQEKRVSFLTITSGPKGTAVYFDGTLKKIYPRFQIAYEDLSGQIVLGSSTVQPDAWPGDVHGLALYSRELTPAEVAYSYHQWTETSRQDQLPATGAIFKYFFTERAGNIVHDSGPKHKDLFIPKTYEVPHHSFLTPPWREFDPTWDYVSDLLRNIVGFIPFGFLMCALLLNTHRYARAILKTTLLGALLSFSIELMQAYIPQRASGITDIITNTLGTTLGALLVRSRFVESTVEGVVARFGGTTSDRV
jgi:VanZ family protein